MVDNLFISDLDGTLLGADSLISPRSRSLLAQAAAEGKVFTVATARTPATVHPLLSDIPLPAPAVVMTGAALWDNNRRRYLDCILMPDSDASIVADVIARSSLIPLLYRMGPDNILQLWHSDNPSHPSALQFLRERSHLQLKKLFPCANPLTRFGGGDTLLFLALGPQEDVKKAVKILSPIHSLSVSWYSDPNYPDVTFLEVFGPGVTKAKGIQRLKSRLNPRRIIAFGDNYNDLPMFEIADCPVAVANAVAEVRRAAALTIGPNTADSVASFIASFPLNTPADGFGSEAQASAGASAS